MSIEATRRVAMKAYLEARQSEDLRRDIASNYSFPMDLFIQVTKFIIGILPLVKLSLMVQNDQYG